MSTNPLGLSNQKALVTGSTSGIGKAIALQLARDGAEVIVHGRDATRGPKVVAEIASAGGRARFVAADLSKAGDVRRLAKENALTVAEGDFVMLHGRFSKIGQPADWVVVDIVRLENGKLAEHWDVVEDEATRVQSRSGNPMFGKTFPD